MLRTVKRKKQERRQHWGRLEFQQGLQVGWHLNKHVDMWAGATQAQTQHSKGAQMGAGLLCSRTGMRALWRVWAREWNDDLGENQGIRFQSLCQVHPELERTPLVFWAERDDQTDVSHIIELRCWGGGNGKWSDSENIYIYKYTFIEFIIL